MQLYKQELKIYRGEDFSIDKVLKNADGSPFVVSKKLQNPHLLISITDTLYSQKDRYVKNYWLSLINVPSFESTKIFNLKELKVAQGSEYPAYNNFSEATLPLQGWYNNEFIEISAVDGKEETYVFYNEGEGYKRYVNNQWVDYQFRFVKRFSQDDTKELEAKTYLYSIQLVTGKSTREYLTDIADNEDIEYSTDVNGDVTSNEELYDRILAKNINVRIDVTAPIVPFTAIPILKPTKMSVVEYAQGDKLW